MLTPEQESDLRTRADRGLCHVTACPNTGKHRVKLTFATIAPVNGRTKTVQAVISGWDCGQHG